MTTFAKGVSTVRWGLWSLLLLVAAVGHGRAQTTYLNTSGHIYSGGENEEGSYGGSTDEYWITLSTPGLININLQSTFGNLVAQITSGDDQFDGAVARAFDYCISVRGVNDEADSDYTLEITYTPVGPPPVASFVTTPSFGVPPQAVALNASASSGTNVTYSWTFDSSVTGIANPTTATPNATFTTAGNHTVTLVVTDAYGRTATTSRVVALSARPSTTLAAANASIRTGQSTTLTAVTTDSDLNLTSATIDFLEPGSIVWITGTGAAGTAWTGAPVGSKTIAKALPLTTPGLWQFRASGTDSMGNSSNPATTTVTVTNDVPVTTLTASQSSAVKGQTVTITSSTTDADGNLTAQVIDFIEPGSSTWTAGTGADGTRWSGSNSAANTLAKSFLLSTAGTWQFRAMGTDRFGGVGTIQTTSITVSADTTAPNAPGNVQASSVGALSFTLGWNAATDDVGVVGYKVLRNGAQIETTAATYLSVSVPTASTTYTMSVLACDAAGNWSPATNLLVTTTALQPPVANFTMTPSVGIAPLTVNFNAGSSTDPNGTITSYSWDFDNNGAPDASGASVSRTFSAAGNYPVKLTITSSSGLSANYTRIFRAIVPPTILLDSTGSVGDENEDHGATGSDYSIQVLQAGTLDVVVSQTNGNGAFAVQISGPEGGVSSGSAVQPGDYNIYVSGVDSSIWGDFTITAILNPGPRGPIPNFSATPLTGMAPLAVNFSAAASITQDSGAIASYQWDFDNNNTVDATGVTAAHTYATRGTYTVKLIVTDTYGLVATKTGTVTVSSFDPVFTTQPVGQTATVGDQITMTVAASGTPAPTFQWLKNNLPILGATGATFTLASAVLTDSATYSVVATNTAGTETSTPAVLTVNPFVPIAPSFTTHPSNQDVTAGMTVTFYAGATGAPAPTYQWFKNGSSSPIGTGSSLSLTLVTAASVGTYTVKATNASGVATSNPATLSVRGYRLTVNGGGTGSPTGGVEGTVVRITAPFTGMQMWGWELAPGTPGMIADSTSYVTDVTMGANNGSVYPYSWPTSMGAMPPRTTIQASDTAPTGVNFVVGATTTNPNGYIIHQQIETSTDFGLTWTSQVLVNSGNLYSPQSISKTLNFPTAGTVLVRAWGGDYTTGSHSVYVYKKIKVVDTPPRFIAQPNNKTAAAGASVTFDVTTEGTGVISYQWFKYLAPIENSPKSQISGATAGSLTLENINYTDVGYYRVLATNVTGTTWSDWAELTVQSPPIVTTPPTDISAMIGTPADFSVGVSSATAVTYQWRKAGAAITGATNATYSIASAQTGDSGSYDVVLTNSVGQSISPPATLTVVTTAVAPWIVVQPASQSVLSGPSTVVNFSVGANGTAPLTYKWFKSGVELTDGAGIAGATTHTLAVTAATLGTAGTYYAVVSNSAGSLSSSLATLTVNPPIQDGTAGPAPAYGATETDGKVYSATPTGWPNQVTPGRNEAVGYTALNFSVNASGEATATLPIAVTSGVAGMEPKLSLAYNHNGGNGYLGVGWSLQGLSLISRRPASLATDGVISAVNLDANDYFALDGQKLIRVSAAGVSPAEYRTEIDSFSKILAYPPTTGTNYGPEKFVVQTKSGLTLEFGLTDDSSPSATASRIKARPPAPAGSVIAWALDTITDRVGNSCKFYYKQIAATGEFYIDHVGYGPSGRATVTFTYDVSGSRPDVSSGYFGGAPWARTKRLEKIESKYDSELMRRYEMTYETSPNTGRSRMIKVQEYEAGTNGKALPAVDFAYKAETDGWEASSTAAFEPLQALSRVRTGVNQWKNGQTGSGFVDVNGDGIPDLLARHQQGPTAAGYVALGSPTGWNSSAQAFAPKWLLGYDNAGANLGVRFVDLDGDGYPDMIRSRDFNYDADPDTGDPRSGVFLNRANGWVAETSTAWKPSGANAFLIGAASGDPDRGARFVDLNGDGRVDVIWSRFVSSNPVVRGALLNTGSGWVNAPAFYPPSGIYISPSDGAGHGGDGGESGVRVIDINGDGLPDILCHWPGVTGPVAHINTGSGWRSDPNYAPLAPLAFQQGSPAGTDFVDVNGDGLPDQVVYRYDYQQGPAQAVPTVSTYLNTGRGWALADTKFNLQQPLVLGVHVPPIYNFAHRFGTMFCDVNGDGLIDMVSTTEYTNCVYSGIRKYPMQSLVYLNNGSGWTQSEKHFSPLPLALFDYDAPSWDPGTQILDVNGDGMPDVVKHIAYPDSGNHSQNAFLNRSGRPDLLENVTYSSGLKTKVNYSTLAQNKGSFYTQGARGSDSETRPSGSPPVQNIRDTRYVVSSITESDGLGGTGTYDLSYHYTALRQDAKEGSLGFERVDVTDSRTNKTSSTAYRQIYPYIGLPREVTHRLANGKLISSTSTSWDSKTSIASIPRIQYPYTAISDQNSYEVDSDATTPFLSKTTVVNAVGAYGEILDQSTQASDGYASTETRTITYSTAADAFPAQVLTSTVTTTASTQSPLPASTKTRVSRFDFDTKGRLATETREPLLTTDSRHLVTTYTYDPLAYGHLTSVVVDGPSLTAPRETKFAYDAAYGGRFLTKKTNAEQHIEFFESYDLALGVAKTHKDINGIETNFTFDGLGRVLTQTSPGRSVDGQPAVPIVTTINRRWSSAQSPSKIAYYVETIPAGAPPSLVMHDPLGRPVRVVGVTPDHRITYTDTFYDVRGNVVRQSRPYFSSASDAEKFYNAMEYDAVGRLTVTYYNTTWPIHPATSSEEASVKSGFSQYTFAGLTTTDTRSTVNYTAADNAVHSRTSVIATTKNSLGSTSQVVESGTATTATASEFLSATLSYSYDGFGHLVKIVDPINATTTYTVDAYGRRTEAVDPNRGTWAFDYNALGETTYQKDAENQETNFTYDRLGRLKTRTITGDFSTTWIYDAASGKGRLASVTSFDGLTESYEYDSFGLQSKFTRTLTGSASGSFVRLYDYDGFQRLKTITHKPDTTDSRFVERHMFNGYGQWVALRNGITGGRYWIGTEYNAEGQVEHIAYGNNVETQRTYLPHGSMVGTIASGLHDTPDSVQKLGYFYEPSPVGSLYKRLDQNRLIAEGITYDALNRLRTIYLGTTSGLENTDTVTHITPVATFSHSYDLAGNLTAKEGVGAYTYFPISEQGPGKGAHAIKSMGGQTFSYDNNGNLKNDGTHSVSWKPFNQPNQITRGGATSSFSYDANLQRLKQVRSGGETVLYLGAGHERRIGSSVDDVFYLSGPLGQMGQLTFRGPLVADVKYFHHDHLGSVDAITRLDGSVDAPQSYDAWGERRSADTRAPGFVPSAERRGFTGHEHLDDLRLIHMNGRIYDPRLGRFISVDPAFDDLDTTQGVNGFSYVQNNPLSVTDPTGLTGEPVKLDPVVVTPRDTAPQPTQGWNVTSPFGRTVGGGGMSSTAPTTNQNFEGQSFKRTVGGSKAIDQTSSRSLDPKRPESILDESDDDLFARVGSSPSGFYGSMTYLRTPTAAAKQYAELKAAGAQGLEAAANVADLAASGFSIRSLVQTLWRSFRGVCFLAGTTVATSSGSVPIETIRVGDRVLTNDSGAFETVVNPATWRKISLKMLNPESPVDVLDIQLLRSPEWIANVGALEGSRMWFSLDEMGLEGWADVVEVTDCPPIIKGSGRIVLATVTHHNSYIVELRFPGYSESLFPTDTHRLYSATQGDWIPAGQLAIGEELATRTGSIRIESINLKLGTYRVFNIEVETDHCFYAGPPEILSHNNTPCGLQGAAKRETGSYTNHHESGKTYDGKGDRKRSQTSAQRVEAETGDRHVATEWTPAKNEREAFKQESRRLDSHGGATSDGNHNKIESPGKKLRQQDQDH